MTTFKKLSLLFVALVLSSSCFSQSLLQITSPANGTAVVPGQTVTFTVSADASVSNIAIFAQNPLSFSQTTTGPLQFSLLIPADTPFDQYQVRAVGVAGGQDVESAPVTIAVISPQFPVKVRTQPLTLNFRNVGDAMPLRVIGTFGDGTQADLTYSSQIFYNTTDPTVATVTNRGIVTATGPGKAFISISGLFNVFVKVAQQQNSDTTPPVTTASPSPGPNSAGWNNSNVTIQFSATDNPGGSGVQSISISASGAQSVATVVPGSTATLVIANEGTTTVFYFSTDNAGNKEQPKSLTIQLDKTPPAISGLPVGCSLWPPNHTMVTVATVSASDALSGLSSFAVTAVSSEPSDPSNPDTIVTGTGLGAETVQLRADRLGNGPGRTYTITATAADVAGNNTSQTATCVVPHDQGH